jgi:hypothetical protein
MAIFIGITKVHEDDASAEYEFSRPEMPDARGRLRIEKATGEVTLVEGIPGDSEDRAYLCMATITFPG